MQFVNNGCRHDDRRGGISSAGFKDQPRFPGLDKLSLAQVCMLKASNDNGRRELLAIANSIQGLPE
jgi:hypothetical protein